MESEVSKVFASCFAELKDPRIDRKKLYPLVEILFVVLCGSICGAESWRDYALFGKEKVEFLRKYFAFENGIPCKNTFARVFAALVPETFKRCFLEWVKKIQTLLNEEVIALDGKCLRGSRDAVSGTSAIHMVSAFATGARLVLAQQKVDEKSNEITAIPKLLKLLELHGQVVTIDAMGCQTAIAQQIIDQGGDYILALKGNQGTLAEDIGLFLETEADKKHSSVIEDQHVEIDCGHGRIETRKCYVSSKIDWLEQKPKWAGLQTVVMIEEKQEIGDKISFERRLFISSLPPRAAKIAGAVRGHWSIENVLHWTLDVVFNEDHSRVRKDHAPENMALIRHIVLNMMNKAKGAFKNIGIKALRKKAAWGESTLDFILKQSF